MSCNICSKGQCFASYLFNQSMSFTMKEDQQENSFNKVSLVSKTKLKLCNGEENVDLHYSSQSNWVDNQTNKKI